MGVSKGGKGSAEKGAKAAATKGAGGKSGAKDSGGKGAKGTGKGSGSAQDGSKGSAADSRAGFKGKDVAKGAAKGKGATTAKGGFGKAQASAQTGMPNAKIAQELEAEMAETAMATALPGLSRRKKGEPDANKDSPLQVEGAHCEVKKHSEMGCALVTMESEAARDAVLKMGEPQELKPDRPIIMVNDVKVQMRAHVNKETKEEVKTDIFVAWGRQAEKLNPLPAAMIAEVFDSLWLKAQTQALKAAVAVGVSQPAVGYPGMVPSALPPASKGMPPNFLESLGLFGGQPPPSQAPVNMNLWQGVTPVTPGAPLSTMAPTWPQANGLGATAPATSYTATANTLSNPASMRAEAPEFTPGAGMTNEYEEYASAVSAAQWLGFPIVDPATGDTVGLDPTAYAASNTPAMQARKQLKIVDPKSGAPIDLIDRPTTSDVRTPPRRTPLAIVDPNSGDKITLDVTPPKPTQPLPIVDPSSGESTKV